MLHGVMHPSGARPTDETPRRTLLLNWWNEVYQKKTTKHKKALSLKNKNLSLSHHSFPPIWQTPLPPLPPIYHNPISSGRFLETGSGRTAAAAADAECTADATMAAAGARGGATARAARSYSRKRHL